MAKIGRNAPCPCGSGKKYKKCCLKKDEQEKIEQRQFWEEGKKTRSTLEKEKEEFFEPSPEEEHGEERHDDEESDFDYDEEYEEDAAESDASPMPEVEIAQIEREIDEPTERENRIIDEWYEQHLKLEDPGEMKAHLYAFIDRHPDLVDKMALYEEVLFEIVHAFAAKDDHAGAAEMLERIRREYPFTYKQSYGYYDLYMAAFKLATGHKNEIPKYLDLFIEYPDHDPDELFELIDLLQMGNCIDILDDFIPRIYVPVCSSSNIFGGNAIMDTVSSLCFAKFAKPDYTRKDIEDLSDKLMALEVPMNEKYCSPEELEKSFSQTFASVSGWKIDDCRREKKLIERYREIAKNFQGWLYVRKGMDWAAADVNTRKVFDYLVEVLPEKKLPKQPFVFSKDLISDTLEKLSKSFLSVASVKYLGTLNAIFHFADYMNETESITPEFRDDIQKWCRELYDESYPVLKNRQFEAVAFQRFPLDYR